MAVPASSTYTSEKQEAFSIQNASDAKLKYENDATYAMQADEGTEGLSKPLKSRHLVMIVMGTSIGMAMWLGSGVALSTGGPAGLFIGLCFSCSIVICLAQSVGELAIMYPLASGFPQWVSKFVDKAPAFALGWGTWLAFTVSVSNEIQGLITVLSFWTTEVPKAAWISIFLVVFFCIIAVNVIFFGEVEVFMSALKFSWLFVAVIACIVVSAGGGPSGETIGFLYWNQEPFPNGFKGFVAVLPFCIFSLIGAELIALVAAETKNPKKSVPRAVNATWIRMVSFYILGSLAVTISVSPTDPGLFGAEGEGSHSSPFVLAYTRAGLPGLAHAMNAIIFVSVLSCGYVQAWGSSRIPVGMAGMRMAPAVFMKSDKQGRPWAGIALCFAIGGGLSYLNVSHSGAQVFEWFASLSSLVVLFIWALIFLSHIRFRKAWTVQGHELSELPWKSNLFPFAPYYGLSSCILMFVVEFYDAVWPLGEEPNAKTFFAKYISMIFMLLLWFGSKIYYKGSFFIPLKDIDLTSGRRYYPTVDEEVALTPETTDKNNLNIFNKFKNGAKTAILGD